MKEKASRIQTSKDVGVQGFSGGKKKASRGGGCTAGVREMGHVIVCVKGG